MRNDVFSKRRKKRLDINPVDKKKRRDKINQLCEYFGVNPVMGEIFVNEIRLFNQNDLLIEKHQKMKRAAEGLGLV